MIGELYRRDTYVYNERGVGKIFKHLTRAGLGTNPTLRNVAVGRNAGRDAIVAIEQEFGLIQITIGIVRAGD